MDRPVSLLHVVGGKEVRNTRKLEQQVVFETEHGCWPHDGGLGEDAPGNLLSAALDACQTRPLGLLPRYFTLVE